MKVSAPALLPILRSDAVGEILARLYLLPEQRWTLSALAEQAGVSLPTLTREADRMVAAGLVLEERIGRTRQLHCNQAARTFEPLRQLLTLTYGPAPVVEAELRGVSGVVEAYIYGSWAARHQGVEGPEPGDIDVLVVGGPDPDEVFEAGERARTRLLREVNIRTVTARSWRRAQPREDRDADAPTGNAAARNAPDRHTPAGSVPGRAMPSGPAGAGTGPDISMLVPEGGDPFLRHVLASPLVPLHIDALVDAPIDFASDLEVHPATAVTKER